MSPAESGEFIVKNAKFVKVHEHGIKSLAKEVSACAWSLLSHIVKYKFAFILPTGDKRHSDEGD